MRGMTLLEILVVMIIIALLAGIAFPQYVSTIGRSREGEGWQFLDAIRSSELRYYAEYNEVFTLAIANLDIDNPLALAVPPLFNYCIRQTTAQDFTSFAIPRLTGPQPRCVGCRTLCLDQSGVKGPPCGSCP